MITNHRIVIECHANENQLKTSEKYTMSWSNVNVSNNQNIIIPYNAIKFLNAITFLGFYIKYGSFKSKIYC